MTYFNKSETIKAVTAFFFNLEAFTRMVLITVKQGRVRFLNINFMPVMMKIRGLFLHQRS